MATTAVAAEHEAPVHEAPFFAGAAQASAARGRLDICQGLQTDRHAVRNAVVRRPRAIRRERQLRPWSFLLCAWLGRAGLF